MEQDDENRAKTRALARAIARRQGRVDEAAFYTQLEAHLAPLQAVAHAALFDALIADGATAEAATQACASLAVRLASYSVEVGRKTDTEAEIASAAKEMAQLATTLRRLSFDGGLQAQHALKPVKYPAPRREQPPPPGANALFMHFEGGEPVNLFSLADLLTQCAQRLEMTAPGGASKSTNARPGRLVRDACRIWLRATGVAPSARYDPVDERPAAPLFLFLHEFDKTRVTRHAWEKGLAAAKAMPPPTDIYGPIQPRARRKGRPPKNNRK